MMRAAFQNSADSRLTDASVFDWSDRDEHALVLGAFSEAGLVATMRGETIRTLDDLRSATHCQFEARTFPGLLLTAGATASGQQNVGLNSLLRLYFLEYAQNLGLQAMYGTVWGGGSRTRLLQKLGYKLQDCSVLVSYAESDLLTQTITLDIALDGASAQAQLTELTSGLRADFPLQIPEVPARLA